MNMAEKDKKNPDRLSSYPVSRLAPPFSLVDIAKEIEQADLMINTRVNSKLNVIAHQIRALQKEAGAILKDARQDTELHRAQCNFKRLPGHTYHLYEKENRNRYFSMLSPEDWNNSPPHTFIGSFRLEADMSWTPADKPADPGDSIELMQHLLHEEQE